MAFTSRTTIDRKPEDVWALLTDFERAPLWMDGIDAMKVVSDGPIRAGSELQFVARGSVRSSTVAKWDPPNQIVLVSKQGGVTATYTYRCQPTADGGTEASLEAECVMKGAWKLLGPLIRFMMKRVDGKQMHQFAAFATAPSAPS